MTEERRTQADRSAATRQALVTAARPLFAGQGFAAVSIEAIVRAAGVTRGAMYHHFADKTELFAAVFETVEAEITERLALAVAGALSSAGTSVASTPTAEPDPVPVMKLGAGLWLDACAEPEIHRIVLVEAPAVLGWERWREIGMRYGTGLVLGMIEHAIAVGRLSAQPAAPLAHVMMGALDEAALYISRAADPVQARTEMGAVVDRLIDAMAQPR